MSIVRILPITHMIYCPSVGGKHDEIKDKSLQGTSFIDLFAGLGGFRIALESLGARCVYSNEWDRDAQKVYAENFGNFPDGDITQVDEKTISNHDILCAGFPCQAFSISGKQKGFEDSRGTLFFDVARIVKEKTKSHILGHPWNVSFFKVGRGVPFPVCAPLSEQTAWAPKGKEECFFQ